MATRNEAAYVLDGYSLLAFLEGAAGSDRLRDLLERSKKKTIYLATTVINVAEVVGLVEVECGLPQAQLALARLLDLPLVRHEVDDGLALAAARCQAQFELSFGDAFAVALARQLGGAVVTGNPRLRQAARLMEVEWLGGGAGVGAGPASVQDGAGTAAGVAAGR